MSINIFEGARRVGYVLLALGVTLFSYALYDKTPYVDGGNFELVKEKGLRKTTICPSVHTRVKVSHPTASVYIDVCESIEVYEIGLPEEDMIDINAAVDAQRLSDLKSGARNIVIGALAWIAFMKVLGWIVRGFLGIPSGQDRKALKPSPSAN